MTEVRLDPGAVAARAALAWATTAGTRVWSRSPPSPRARSSRWTCATRWTARSGAGLDATRTCSRCPRSRTRSRGRWRSRAPQPGDVLELEIRGYETAEFGWTAVIPGYGPLGDLIDRPFLVRWDLADGAATSEDLPGITVAASTHAGCDRCGAIRCPLRRLAGARATAQSTEATWCACPIPRPRSRLAVADGLRTMPPRENGGNMDVRDLGPGATLLLPGPRGRARCCPPAICTSPRATGRSRVYAIETSGSVTFEVGLRSAPSPALSLPGLPRSGPPPTAMLRDHRNPHGR